MRILLVIGCGQDLVTRICGLLPDDWLVEALATWHECVRRLSSGSPPDLLLFTDLQLSDEVRRSVVTLRSKRYFVPAAVYLPDPSPELAHFAGTIHRHGVEAI